ncbi:MAG: FMN-binding protein [Actinobacteria bacterium]|nr:FMN-binding protein [Actinomycetota bacterium]
MSTSSWRGTVLFTGTLATIAVAAGTKFAAAADLATPSTAGGSAATTQTGSASGTAAGVAAGTAAGAAAGATTASQVLTGSVVSTRYGNVQVAVTFTNGVISSVATLQAPSGRESSQINAYATPILAKEAVAANSATIDTVSGATFTSQAYTKSLQSAIDQRG